LSFLLLPTSFSFTSSPILCTAVPFAKFPFLQPPSFRFPPIATTTVAVHELFFLAYSPPFFFLFGFPPRVLRLDLSVVARCTRRTTAQSRQWVRFFSEPPPLASVRSCRFCRFCRYLDPERCRKIEACALIRLSPLRSGRGCFRWQPHCS